MRRGRLYRDHDEASKAHYAILLGLYIQRRKLVCSSSAGRLLSRRERFSFGWAFESRMKLW